MQSPVLILRPAVFKRDVLSLYVAGFHRALANSGHSKNIGLRRPGSEKSDHFRLLCSRSKRPRDYSAAKRHDELAPSQKIFKRIEECALFAEDVTCP